MPRTNNAVTDPALLEAALEGLLLQRQRLEEQISHVRTMLSAHRASSRSRTGSGLVLPASKRQLSDAARKRIAAAQKKRWAEYRKAAAAEK